MSWLQEHEEKFVKPVLGYVPDGEYNYFSDSEMRIIKNVWRSVKKIAEGRVIVLPGRDVFIFECLARRENYPTKFIPECSRKTVRHLYLNTGLDVTNAVVFDTGFVGSIPFALCSEEFRLMSHNGKHPDVQVFPSSQIARDLALKIEKTPKYWDTAYVEQGRIIQRFSGHYEFETAARLTRTVYTNSTRRVL